MPTASVGGFRLFGGLARGTGWGLGFWDWGRGFLTHRYGLGWLVGGMFSMRSGHWLQAGQWHPARH